MLWLSAEDCRKALPMKEALDVVAKAYQELSSGDALVPIRTALNVDSFNGVTLVMPAHSPGSAATAVKVVSVYPDNPSRGLPTILGAVLLLDARTGRPTALLDGAFVTALRTGAAAGCATRLLSNDDARSAALIGTGAQASFQLDALLAARPGLEHIRVFDIDLDRLNSFVRQQSERIRRAGFDRVQLIAARSAHDAVANADIITTVTTSNRPVFPPDAVKPGAHINGIGSFKPTMQETPPEIVERSRVFVDSVEAVLEEAGDLIIPLREGRITEETLIEIGHVLGHREEGRRSKEELTFFKSVGLAVQDVAAAAAIYNRALELGLGQRLES